jgi:hypothetical protein
MSDIVYQKEVPNDLGAHTGWDDHEALVVGVHRKFTFNSIGVAGVVEIFQPDGSDLEDFREVQDFRDCFCGGIQTTPEGARELAKALNEAADAADAAIAKDFVV